MLAAHQGFFAEAEDEIRRGHPAEVLVERTHGQPVTVGRQPGLDPVVGGLLRSLRQRETGDDARGEAAIAQQCEQQSALGQAIAVLGRQAFDGAGRGTVSRIVFDLLRDEAIQGLGDVVLVGRTFQLGEQAARGRGDSFAVRVGTALIA